MRKVKWGVLGTAYICQRDTLPGMLQAENCELYAIAGRDPEKVRQFQEQYGFQKAYDSYQALLEDAQVEAVYIPLPNTMHYEWTIQALNHKKHVLCEKPLAPTQEQAEQMFAAAQDNGVLLMEAFAYLHSPYIQAIREEVSSGRIGTVRYMGVRFFTSDYDISNIRMRKETLGGSMYDIGVYASSLILKVLGQYPETVQATALMDENEIDKLTTVTMAFADGKKASLTTGMVMATEKNQSSDSFEIHGTEGAIYSDAFTFNGRGELSYIVKPFCGEPEHKVVSVPNNYTLEVEQFGRCILGGELPAVTKEISVENAKVVDRVLDAIHYR